MCGKFKSKRCRLKVIVEEIIFEEELDIIKSQAEELRFLSEDFQELSLKLSDLEELHRDFKNMARACRTALSFIGRVTCEFEGFVTKINQKLSEGRN
jgi:inactivated superfamily I helicase